MNYKNLTTYEIYQKGKNDPDFDYDKGLDALLEKDENGQWVYDAGMIWKTFDYNKGLDALISKDKDGRWVYYAGRVWKEFNYKKGLKYLLKIKFNYLEGVLKYWKFPKEKLSNEEVLEFINLI